MSTKKDMAPFAYSMTVIDSKKVGDLMINADSPTTTKKISGFGQYYNMPNDEDNYRSYGSANYMMRFMKDMHGTYIKFKTIFRTEDKADRKIKSAARSGLEEFQKHFFDHNCEP